MNSTNILSAQYIIYFLGRRRDNSMEKLFEINMILLLFLFKTLEVKKERSQVHFIRFNINRAQGMDYPHNAAYIFISTFNLRFEL